MEVFYASSINHTKSGVDMSETLLFASVIDGKTTTNNDIIGTTAPSIVSFPYVIV